MEFLFLDKEIAVCIKPPRVLSTDEPGGMPELVRQALGNPAACVRTVHRLDRVVGGLMVLARSPETAAALSAQIRAQTFGKAYLAVVHGAPDATEGVMTDLLLRDKRERKTYIVHHLEKGVQEAVLDYRLLTAAEGMSLVHITLRTGRTHQIRAQFSSRGLPLVGDRKYGAQDDGCEIALWSHALRFAHPITGRAMHFAAPPPDMFPWNRFAAFPFESRPLPAPSNIGLEFPPECGILYKNISISKEVE